MTAGRSPFIVGPVYDWVFFLATPVLALLAGIAISGTPFTQEPLRLFGRDTTAAALLIGTVIHGHLVAVLFRSHANPAIFRLHRFRFLIVPIALYAVVVSSPVMGVSAMVLATFWDVWHSAAQTFGLGRIYDRNAGNPPEPGRRLDFALNQLFYAGPILAGATMLDHVRQFGDFEKVDLAALAQVPGFMERTQPSWRVAIFFAGGAIAGWYAYSYGRLRRSGYRVSPHKVLLVGSTGLCSIYCWGFDSWGEAFFIMNLLHAVQYLALVWATEHRSLLERLRLSGLSGGKVLLLLAFATSVLGYGAFAYLLDPDLESLWAVTIVISLLHFWYDGFIWSVRRAQV